jgi:GNAT superfamily N-acetyltransferase
MPDSITLRDERADGAAATSLLAGFDGEIARLYPSQDPSTMLRTHASEFEPPRGAFLVAYVGDMPVGCGGVRRLADGIAEVKRVFVAPHARSRGVARRIVSELERLAAERGYRAIRLDTAPAAIARSPTTTQTRSPATGSRSRSRVRKLLVDGAFNPVLRSSRVATTWACSRAV